MDECTRIEFLLQADHDQELDIGGTAALAAHLALCPECRAKQAELRQLSTGLRTELPYHAASARLLQSIVGAIAASRETAVPTFVPSLPHRPDTLSRWRQLAEGWVRRLLPVGTGAAIAVAAAMIVILPRGNDMTDSVIVSHIRALQPGHLTDVVSTDQHTVKPWFDGKLDYSPPVRDLAAQGFPLIGGRLDYLAGRPVAALAYGRAKHVIDLYVWPSASHIDAPPGGGEHSGYNFVRWTEGEMVFWVVSDVSKADLNRFAMLWRGFGDERS